MANKTWVQLAQALRREAGVQGDGPSAVTNQSGIYGNIVAWIDDAWLDLQSMHDNWKFMRGFGSITTLTGTRDYTMDPVPKRVEPHSVIAVDSDGLTSNVTMLDWSLFQERYRTHVLDDDAYPVVCTVTPGGDMRFADYTLPDYTVNYEYAATPSRFSVSSSTPTLPAEFENVIVFKALIDYGLFYNAPESIQHGQIRYSEILASLKEDQLIRPTVKFGSFLNRGMVGVSRFI